MRLLDLFSGIGGFALAASWVWPDLEIAGFCEIDQYAQRVLAKHWPDVPIYPDIRELRGRDFPDIHLITGGFPCQDISVAGKGAGIHAERSGLWFEMHRVISEVRPRFALVENVPALTFRGLATVLGSLAEIGYDAEWQIVSAADMGAPHLRKRIWIVAYAPGRQDNRRGRAKLAQAEATGRCSDPATHVGREDVADIGATGLQDRYAGTDRRGPDVEPAGVSSRQNGEAWPTKSHMGRSPDGLPYDLDGVRWPAPPGPQRAWEPPRVAIGVKDRVDRLKCLGNAIVPQCAAVIMERIKAAMIRLDNQDGMC